MTLDLLPDRKLRVAHAGLGRVWPLVEGALLAPQGAHAHWCSNIWTAAARLVVKPERDTVYVGTSPSQLPKPALHAPSTHAPAAHDAAALAKELGADPAGWAWGKLHRVTFE